MQYRYYILQIWLAFLPALGKCVALGQMTNIYQFSSPPYNGYSNLTFNSDWGIGPIFDKNGVQYLIGLKTLDIPYLISNKDNEAPRNVDFTFFSTQCLDKTQSKEGYLWSEYSR